MNVNVLPRQLVQVDGLVYEYRTNPHGDVVCLVNESTVVDAIQLEYDPYWSRVIKFIEFGRD
jgi:hypothetical protein